MEMKQIYEFTNTAVKEVLGGTAVVEEDLSNVVDVGKAIFDANAFDAYVKSLVNHIGKVIFVNRSYTGNAPSVLMDGWEYGSVMEKITSEMPVAVENDSWNLVDGKSYDPHVFHQPKAEAKFFNKRTTFEIDRSIAERQVKQSFSSATQLNAFVSMLFNEVQKALTVRTESLIMRTINNMIAVTMHTANPVRAVNLMTGFKALNPDSTVTATNAIYDPAFIRYAALQMRLYVKRMSGMTTLFNEGGKQRFTPSDLLHIVGLNDFIAASDVYLQSDTFHDEYTRLQKADIVPYWQGPGTDYTFNSVSSINVTPLKPDGTTGEAVNESGIIFAMFDHDALGVANFDYRVTTEWNPKAEFTNYFYKQDAGYFNDFNEQFVVFYVKDAV